MNLAASTHTFISKVNCDSRYYRVEGTVRTVDHSLDLGAGELADSVGDGDVGAAAGRLLGGSDLQDTVDVDLEDNFKGGITSLHWWDGREGELSEGGVVLAVSTFTLVDRELDGLLVVDNSGEGTLLDGWDSLATGDDGSEDVTLHGNTERERDDVQKEEVAGVSRGGLSREDTGLDGGTVGNGLVGVDTLTYLLIVNWSSREKGV